MVLCVLFALDVNGVVLLTLPEATERVFNGIQAAMISDPYLASLQWVMGMTFRNGQEYNRLKDIIKGLIYIDERSNEITDFKSRFTSLNPSANQRNPWFRTYWEQKYNCTVGTRRGSGIMCGFSHQDLHQRNFVQASHVSQTISAVYTFASAIREARNQICQSSTGFCNALALITPDRIMQYMKSASFLTLDNQVISFNQDGALTQPAYTIYNVQIDGVGYTVEQVITLIK